MCSLQLGWSCVADSARLPPLEALQLSWGGGGVQSTLGSQLKDFLEFTQGLDPETRGESIGSFDAIRFGLCHACGSAGTVSGMGEVLLYGPGLVCLPKEQVDGKRPEMCLTHASGPRRQEIKCAVLSQPALLHRRCTNCKRSSQPSLNGSVHPERTYGCLVLALP